MVVAAMCSLVAGPGYVGMRTALACVHHSPMAMPHAHANQSPCFCNAMTGALDAAPAATVQTPVTPVVVTMPVVTVASHSRFPIPVSPFLTPETPPPNAIA